MSASTSEKSSHPLGTAIHAIALTIAMALIATELPIIPSMKTHSSAQLDYGSPSYTVTHLPSLYK